MADIGISSNCVLRHFNAVPNGDDSGNSLLGDECHTTNKCNSHSKDINDEDNTSEKLIIPEYKPENESKPHSEPSQSIASSSKELPGDNHSVWLSSAIKSEIEEPEEIDTGSGEDEGSEYEEEKEEKMEEESDSEDDDDSEGGAYHLAEVSYGEEDEQDSVKREKGESESILGISQDLPDLPMNYIDDGTELRTDVLLEHNSPMAGRYLTYLCRVCGHRALGKDSFLKHVQQHAGLYGTQANDRRPYRRIKHPDRVYMGCIVCAYKSNNKDSLTKHLLDTHPSEFSYCCPNCEFNTNKYLRLRSHMGKHHNLYTCTQCPYKTERVHYLKEHYRTHTKEKPFACNECSFRCSSKNSLGKHMRIHTGETPYHCKLCDRKFKQSGHLTEHMRQHTGEKPFKCHICDYRCAYRGLINKHIKTHSDEKPFACTVCEFRGKTRYTLTSHMRLHTGEKAYTCEECEFSCNSRSTFRDHEFKHNGKLPPHVCDVCDARFIRARALKRHAAAHERQPRTLTCNVCGMLFLSRMKLHEHYTTHPRPKQS